MLNCALSESYTNLIIILLFVYYPNDFNCGVKVLLYCCMPDNYWINYGLHVPPRTAISLCYMWAETDCMSFLCCSVEIVIINNTK